MVIIMMFLEIITEFVKLILEELILLKKVTDHYLIFLEFFTGLEIFNLANRLLFEFFRLTKYLYTLHFD